MEEYAYGVAAGTAHMDTQPNTGFHNTTSEGLALDAPPCLTAGGVMEELTGLAIPGELYWSKRRTHPAQRAEMALQADT